MDEQRKQEARAILANQHVQWCRLPTTIGAFTLLDDLIASLENHIEAQATNFKSTTDFEIRLYVGQLKVVKQIKKQLHETKSFVEKSIK
tara:strand:+ start:27205 stop:27471 length:267 start_codon:yes stop_codon:yes gene_type:complete